MQPSVFKPKNGPLYFFYIDDSGDEYLSCYTAMGMPEPLWQYNFDAIKSFRAALKASDEILLRSEFHATEFIAGRGRLGPQIVSKRRRCEIFNETLSFVASKMAVRIINVACKRNKEQWVFERLMNRIQRNMQGEDGSALLFCDQGKEDHYTKLVRKMKVFNPIPSMRGAWETGKPTKSIALDRIVEDPVFKNSRSSYFIQLADFCAYALLRKERPLASKTKYGLDRSFFILDPVLVKQASYSDPHGIVR